jgi:hypothetical protein
MLTITVKVGEGTCFEIPSKHIKAISGLLHTICVGASNTPVESKQADVAAPSGETNADEQRDH